MNIATMERTQRNRATTKGHSLRCVVGVKTAMLLVLSSLFQMSTSFKVSLGQHYEHRPRSRHLDLAVGAAGAAPENGLSSSPFPSATSNLQASVNETSQVTVKVKRSGRNPVDTSQLAGCGSTFYASGYEDGNNDGLVLMQTLSGVTQDGQEVIAVVAPGKFSAGSSVLVEARHLVDKPKGLDWERAAMLPFLVVNCLCPLLEAGFCESTTHGKTFIVTGGHGSLGPFVVQVLRAWGGKVCCVTTRSQGAVQSLGAETTVDFRQDSYSEIVQDFSAVVDTLGREKEGAQRILQEAKGAAYISLQPKVLKVAVEEGVLFGAGKILQYQSTVAKDNARTYFFPNAEAMKLVSQLASMAGSKSIDLGLVGTEYVGMKEYMEALAWPKDSETGLRFGFPGKTNRSWGWLGGGYDEDDDFPWEGEEDEEEEEEDAEEEGSSIAKGVSAGNIEGPAVPTGKVVRLKSRQELQALTGKGGTIVFVSSRSCRACKFLKTFYRKLALKQQQVWFASVDASAHPELARDLGLKAVPSFITFREGNVVTASSTSDKRKIEKLLEELMYD